MTTENLPQNTSSNGLFTLLVILSIIAILSFIVLLFLYKNREKSFLAKKKSYIKLPTSDFEAIVKMLSDCAFVYYAKSDIIELNDDFIKKLHLDNTASQTSYNDFLEYISISDKEIFRQTITPIKNNMRQIDCLQLELIGSKLTINVKCLLICKTKDLLGKCKSIGGYIICNTVSINNNYKLQENNAFELMMQKQMGMGYWQYDNVTKKVYLSESAASLYYDKNRIININIDTFMQIFSSDSAAELMIKISSPSQNITSDYEILQNINLPTGEKRQFNVVCKSHYKDGNLTYITAISFQIPSQKKTISKKQLYN